MTKLNLLEEHLSFGGTQYKYGHFSKTLDCDMTFSLYLPSNKENKEISLIWWLSGLTCTDDTFAHKSNFQNLANKYQVAVAIPDTSPRGENVFDVPQWDLGQGAGFYLNATEEPWKKNYKMYDYILNELTNIVYSLVPNFSKKESIMGHSMGGHGALVVGMKNSNRFKSISAFAPILNPSQVPWGINAFNSYLGKNKDNWRKWDATELIKNDNIQPILIMQGTKDQFYIEHLNETAFLENAKNKPVTYKKVEGYDHSYYFISTFLKEHFEFHMKYLK